MITVENTVKAEQKKAGKVVDENSSPTGSNFKKYALIGAGVIAAGIAVWYFAGSGGDTPAVATAEAISSATV